MKPLTPNLRLHTRDKAHATKRILTRPFDADEFLKGIVDRYIMNKNTLTSVIYYSGDLLDYFKQRCKAHGLPESPIGLAKHRFSCMRKVLTLHCTHKLPFMDTSVYILGSRPAGSVAVQVANVYLAEPDEVSIQVGMMAVASGQVMQLLRFVDVHHPDLSRMGWEVADFRNAVRQMWSAGGVLNEPQGMFRVMLKQLEIPFTYQHKREVTVVGGTAYAPEDPLVQRALGRMRVWQTLALATTSTEFPSYELCQSFSVLALGPQRKDLDHTLVKNHLRRLSLLTGESAAELQEQHKIFFPAASMYYNVAGLTTMEAWRRSLLREHGTRWASRAVANKALLNTVVKCGAAGVSTHSLDSLFSVIKLRKKSRAAGQSEISELDTVQLLVGAPEAERDAIIKDARALWCKWKSGVARKMSGPRIDKGQKRNHGGCKTGASGCNKGEHGGHNVNGHDLSLALNEANGLRFAV